jgi:hypothetical protein
MPDPALVRRTLLARAIAAHELGCYSMKIVADLGADPATGGGIPSSRKMGRLYRRYKFMAVLCARIVGEMSWEEVADWLGIDHPDTAIALYGAAEERWRAGEAAPWVPEGEDEAHREHESAMPIHIPEATAAEVDAFHARLAQAGRAPGRAEQPGDIAPWDNLPA